MRYPGAIPLDTSRPPATDLIGVDGNLLPLYKAQQLRKNGFNLSNLDPKESNIWKDEGFLQLANHYRPIEIDRYDQVTNVSLVRTPAGTMRFNGTMKAGGGHRIYTFRISKRIHNVLLRAALLKKLGYSIPPIKYLDKVRINFSSVRKKEKFIEDMKNTLLTNDENVEKRWIAENQKESTEIVLQDLIATSMNHHTYNLADGFLSPSHIKGQRVLNALLVPYHLTDVPESVNLFSWRCGKVVNNNIIFDYLYGEQFSTSMEDALWILKRILKLTRADFREIVASANYPKEVSLLMVEKLIEKRNNCKDTLNIKHGEKIATNPHVTYGEFLEDGKLLKKLWGGKGSMFSFGDPESPLNTGEVFAFMKSKFNSNIISNLVMRFNKFYLPKTDLASEIYQKQYDKALKRLANYVKTRKVEKTNFGVWAIPQFGVNAILSRDIVAGSYMGTDNTIQLADSIGVNVDGGVYLGTDGIPAPWTLSGGAKVFVNRVYTHLKPIKSIKKALKEPFKNMLVPWLKRGLGHTFDLLVPGNFPKLKKIFYLDPIRDYVTTTANLAIMQFQTHGSKLETPIIEKAQRQIYSILESKPGDLAEQKRLKTKLKNLTSVIKNMAAFAHYKNALANALNQALSKNSNNHRDIISLYDDATSLIDKEIQKYNLQNTLDVSSPIQESFYKKMHKTLGLINTLCESCIDQSNLSKGPKQARSDEFSEITSKIDLITNDPNTIIQREITRTMQDFKNKLEVGESIVITDSLGGEFSINGGFSFSEAVSAIAQFRSQLLVISRLHIHRKDENTIQIYKDLGKLGSIRLSLGIHAKIPIISVSFEVKKGTADVKFYQLNIGETDQAKNPDILPTVQALRSLFLDNSTEAIEIVNIPYTLKHDFKAKSVDLSLLWFQWKWQNDYDFVTITHPKSYGFFLLSKEPTSTQLPALVLTNGQLNSYKQVGQRVEKRAVDVGDITDSKLKYLKFNKNEKAYLTRKQCDFIESSGSHNCPEAMNKYFFKTRRGKRSGKNYEKLVMDVVNALIKENSSEEVVLSSINNGDSGNSFWGVSTVRQISYEAEVKKLTRGEDGQGWGVPLHPFINLNYRWKGFKLSKDKANEILGIINKKFGSDLYPSSALHSTKNLQLYSISLNLFIYEKGINFMAKLPESKIETIFKKFMDIDVDDYITEGGEFDDDYIVMHGIVPHTHYFYEDAYADARGLVMSRLVDRFRKYQKRYKKALRKRDLEKISKYTAKMASLIEASLPIDGMAAMVGGRDNLYVNSTINGFREGDENGDSPYVSNTIGEFGDKYFMGPMYSMKNRLGMTDAEFYINWLLGRL